MRKVVLDQISLGYGKGWDGLARRASSCERKGDFMVWDGGGGFMVLGGVLSIEKPAVVQHFVIRYNFGIGNDYALILLHPSASCFFFSSLL